MRDQILTQTRMHSSRMRTARLLPLSPSMHSSQGRRGGVPCPRGVYLVWGVPGPGGCTWVRGCVPGPVGVPGPGGVPGPRVCTWSRGIPGPGRCTWSQRGVYLVRGILGLREYLVQRGYLPRHFPL